MQLIKRKVYLPLEIPRHSRFHIFDLHECEGSFIGNVAEESGYFFTSDEFRELIEYIKKSIVNKARVEIIDHEEVNVETLPGYWRPARIGKREVILPIYGVDEDSIESALYRLFDIKNRIIIKTSNLGYDMSFYKVCTNLSIKELRHIEYTDLPTNRSNSTSIQQLAEVCKKHGAFFEYEVIAERLTGMTPETKNLKVDYTAHFGNY